MEGCRKIARGGGYAASAEGAVFEDAAVSFDADRRCALSAAAELISQHFLAHRVGFNSLLGLRFLAVVGLFDRVERFLFLRPVARAEGFRAFEGHMLQHMGQAGLPGGVVNAAHVYPGVKRDHR